MRLTSLLFVLLCAVASASAQYNAPQNKIWAFGTGAGLNFNTGAPVAITSNMASNEGAATVCDNSGNLLFYTDGRTVYNRLGIVMPGGAAVVSFLTTSTTQGAAILPFFNDPDKYYLFSLEQRETGGGQLAYSVIDMTLDGGLGDVVTGSSGIIIASGMSEKMVIIPGNACNAWLMVHKSDLAQFHAFQVTASGVSTSPVVSYTGTFSGAAAYSVGAMKCSHDRQKIATAVYPYGPGAGLELYDFDPNTGLVSNCRLLETTTSHYGLEFSPDNTRLYASRSPICQWDVSLATTAAIIASKTAISPSSAMAMEMRLAPDGKIYINEGGGVVVDRINNPNAAGTACGYVAAAVNLSPGLDRNCFPTLVWNVRTIAGTATLCAGATTTFTTTLSGGSWSSSNTAIATVSAAGVVTAVAPGTSVISYTTGTGCDGALPITVVAAPALTTPPLCVGNVTAITASTGAGTWVSSSTSVATVGATSGIVTGLSAGTVVVTYYAPGCPAATTVLTVNPLALSGGGAVCMGSTVSLSATPAGGVWSTAATGATVSAAGVVAGTAAGPALISYSLGAGCVATSTVTVNATPPIAGVTSLCTGSTATLSTFITGGTWSSSDVSVAPVGAASGVVTGMAPGTALISYTTPAGCVATAVVTVGSPAINGGTVCVGGTVTLPTATPGGTWLSGNPSVATVGFSSGLVTGVAPGTATITYSLWSGCSSAVTVTVIMGSPAGNITLCVGETNTLAGGVPGGTWSSSIPAVATVGSSSGVVSAMSAGTAVISYANSGRCTEPYNVTVYPLPAAIGGPVTVVAGSSVTLTNAAAGGTWSSADTTIAKVNAATGKVTGIAPGTVTIYYTLPTGCKVSVVITVTGKVAVSAVEQQASSVVLYPNPAGNDLTIQADPVAYTTCAVYNMLWQELMRTGIAEAHTKLDLEALPPGCYQVVCSGAGGRQVARFVKW